MNSRVPASSTIPKPQVQATTTPLPPKLDNKLAVLMYFFFLGNTEVTPFGFI
jgi:hypothetical protein